MDVGAFFKLFLVSCIAIVLTIVFYLLERKTKFGKLPFIVRQIIIGIVFGGAAIFSTEKGVPITGAVLNARDAAPLAAGFFFGGPAGIIAGLIGGIERALAYFWLPGNYTVIACSVTTSLAGFYAAFIRKFVFEDKRPSPLFCFVFGIIIEMFHMSMVYFTHTNDPVKVLAVLKAATLPMILANSLSVFGSACALLIIHKILYKQPIFNFKKKPKITSVVQYALLGTIIISFLGSYLSTYSIQTKIAEENISTTMEYTLDNTRTDISNEAILKLLEPKDDIKKDYDEGKSLEEIKDTYELYDIHIVNTELKILDSTNSSHIGYYLATSKRFEPFQFAIVHGFNHYYDDYDHCPFDLTTLNRYVIAPVGEIRDKFVLYSYSESQMHDMLNEYMVHYSATYVTSDTSKVTLVDNKTKSVIYTNNVMDLDNEEYIETVTKLVDTKVKDYVKRTINDKANLLSYKTIEGYSIVTCLDSDTAYLTRDLAIHVNSDSIVLVFGILFILIYILIKYLVVKKIRKVNQSLELITQGNLDEVLKDGSIQEFNTLSSGINTTVDTLKQYIAEAEARIDRELEFARTIQLSALPNNFPKVDEFEIYAHSIPAKEVGGDFYDFYYTENGNLVVMIADVSGKGIPAAMFMMHAKTELKALGETDTDPGETFTRGNNAICEGNEANMFVTAWQANIDLETGKVKFANAGHNPPLLMRYGHDFEYINNKKSLVLGVMEGVNYKDQELQLNPGDVLALYTDGVTEATNSKNELFGEQRVLEELNKCKDKPLKEIYNHMKAKIIEFQGDAPQFDDITFLAIRYKGKK